MSEYINISFKEFSEYCMYRNRYKFHLNDICYNSDKNFECLCQDINCPVWDKFKKSNKGVSNMNKTIIEVKGGVIQAIRTTDPIKEFEIRDYDNEEQDQVYKFEPEIIKDEGPTKKIFIEWSIEDIHQQASEMDIKLTDEEAGEILDTIERDHDAELGISWMTIECAIHEMKNS